MCLDCYADTVAGTSLEGRRHLASLPQVRALTAILPDLLVSPDFFNPIFHVELNNSNFDHDLPTKGVGRLSKSECEFRDAWNACAPIERAIALSVAVRDWEPELTWT